MYLHLQVAGVELFQMGQTNKLGRYPLHFHLMGEDGGARSFMRDCAVHRSYYRCISIHGSSNATISQNVAYDVTGYCYCPAAWSKCPLGSAPAWLCTSSVCAWWLWAARHSQGRGPIPGILTPNGVELDQDGVEENNLIEFNLAAHVHVIGTPAWSSGHFIKDVHQTDDLLLPADVTASGFYITNARNSIIGNAASGGWAGFALPVLPRPVMAHRAQKVTPSSRTFLAFDGNTAHSTGFWWHFAGAIYVGGKLWHPNEDSDKLIYNPGRGDGHDTCSCDPATCGWCETCGCKEADTAFTTFTNTKVFLVQGVGVSHWGSRVELLGLEAHDVGIAASILGTGYITNMLVRCRTGAALPVPCDSCDPKATLRKDMGANGFNWYDTGMAHIITDSHFSRCGAADDSGGGGCGDTCSPMSSVWGFLTHSDQFVPEAMQVSSKRGE